MGKNTQAPVEHPKPVSHEILRAFWNFVQTSHMDKAMTLLEANPGIVLEPVPAYQAYGTQLFLNVAFKLPHSEFAAFGVAHGAPLEGRGHDGETAMHALFAINGLASDEKAEGFRHLIEPMLSMGAQTHATNRRGNPVWFEAFDQPFDVWKKLLPNSHSLDFFNNTKNSSLSAFARDSKLNDKAKWLIDKGVNVNAFIPDALDSAPLMSALANQNHEMADYLFAHGANIHLKDEDGQGFLHLANKTTTVEWLVNHCIDIDSRDTAGNTPLLRVLKSTDGDTNIHRLQEKQDVAIALIRAGADLNARTGLDKAPSAKKMITSKKTKLPDLYTILLAFNARQVAMQSLNEMDAPAP